MPASLLTGGSLTQLKNRWGFVIQDPHDRGFVAMQKALTIFFILIAGILYSPDVKADDGKGLSLLNTPDGIIRGQAGRDIYIKHCASCHHAERYGLRAPALIPETLKPYKKEELAGIIKDGLPATQMPSFKKVLTDQDVEKLVSYITIPIENVHWTDEDIQNSREIAVKKESPAVLSGIDRENITLIVESGKSVTVMNGSNFESLDKFSVGAIHGGPKFSHALRYIYAPTRDGVITKYDIDTLQKIGTIKVGVNMRNIALSEDDKLLAAANYLPNNMIVLDSDFNLIKRIDVTGKIGGIYALHNKKEFVCSFRDAAELWFIDYNKGFAIEKIALPEPFEDISISPFEDIIIGASRKGTKIYVYSFKDKKIIGSFDTEGMPHLASATYWIEKGALYTAVNHLKRPVLTILDLNNLKVVKEITLEGSGFFVRTHQATPYIWVDTNTDKIQLVDKATQKVAKTLIPSDGKKAMHIEFTKDGRYALVSIYEEEGALVIYDAFNLNEIKRLPFKKPAGKYNALNKTYPGRMLKEQMVLQRAAHKLN